VPSAASEEGLKNAATKTRTVIGSWGLTLSVSAVALAALGPSSGRAGDSGTRTPIKHVIVLIGENRTFDHVFATYKAKHGQSLSNLLSRGIIDAQGLPGVNATDAEQFTVNTPLSMHYFMGTGFTKTPYSPYLPTPELGAAPNHAISLTELTTDPTGVQPPFGPTITNPQLASLEPSLEKSDLFLLRTGATGAPGTTGPDTRVATYNTLPNTVFQLTGPTLDYDSYTGDMVHRFFHMWQQSDCNLSNATPANPAGCLNDLYPYVGIARGDDSGANSMGFYNVQEGDAPVFKKLADQYTLSDNFHQSVMGGTAANHVALGTGDAIFWTTFNGLSTPPASTIANPDPQSPNSDKYTADKQWTNCSDTAQPGIAPIVNYLSTLSYKPAPNCEPGHFYMVNNLSPGFLPNGTIDTTNITSGTKVPPSTLRTIGDALNEKKISWAYYGGGYNAAVRVANAVLAKQTPDPADVFLAFNYCDICNFESYVSSIMGNATQRATHIKDATDFFDALDDNNLPAVSFVKPDSMVDGHPASSKLDLFEAMLENIVDKLTSRPELFKNTALFVAFDEGGGYWDSSYFQPLDFFGDGPRVPFIVVSPYSRGGKVVHTYYDHVSVLKFIERNWGLQPLTGRSRDNLKNPTSAASNPYVPTNPPAIGDLFEMFDFARGSDEHGKGNGEQEDN
jgi:phospholipase C